jgi:outer membrane receptor protein involved in Fe transport
VDYSLPLSQDRTLRLGLDFQKDDDDFGNSGDSVDPATGLRVSNPAITNYFQYSQKINTAYGSYQATLDGWTVLAGLRVEDTSAAFPEVTGNVSSSNRYAGTYPSLHVDRSLSEQSTLSFSVGRRVTRPDPEALNPFIDRQDTQNLRAGNPNLRPEDTSAGNSHTV